MSTMREWFENSGTGGEPGLCFECTMCGNCCTGPEGYVLVSDAEVTALSLRLGLSREAFLERYTHVTSVGRSLIEITTERGNDCVFLDRVRVPGKAVCGVYEDRPMQCRTWPFWKSNLVSRHSWERAKRVCPGIDKGARVSVTQIRVRRDSIEI